ncbi:uncharacterized protein SAPINGB_P005293 [Magnusiomyces paraingens]|uniref:DNA-directed RNA polymerase RpoA/D/Rpb3-type domain-containing protein n=1 Tax=Magnusiomyces paraingens TaxID=2606893 RepID=A0A5E8C6E8_9ASCO|nr:uncharacterized protein SAPINGB_P005293 [Saprochaete ingens]VVT56806.1 unnamed protein product [Saprochaete ingens]
MSEDKIVGIKHDRVTNVTATDFPGHYNDVENAWSLDTFKKQLDIKIHYLTDDVGNFDLIGADSSIANAFRRIMMAEVPTVAFEEVVFTNNTGIMHDEVLASRIGLVPLKIDPDKVEWYPFYEPAPVVDGEKTSPANDRNTVPFSLKVSCTHKPGASKNKNNSSNSNSNSNNNNNNNNNSLQKADDLYEHHTVFAKDLVYAGSEEQLEKVFGGVRPEVLYPDIVLTKLRPGQEIDLMAYAVLGVGSDHAKFSPVATASYRLMPHIELLEPIEGAAAEKLQTLFSPGVIGIEDGQAVVKDARRDTVSREVFRHEEFKDKVRLGRKRDHFIYHVESTGAMQPDEIFVKSIDILRNKCLGLLQYDLA